MTGIICAMQIEADGLIALMENTGVSEKYGMTFTRGTIHGREAVVVVCGIGKVNAAMCAAVLINDYSPSLVINSGVAGSTSPELRVGDIVVADRAVEHDMNATALGSLQGEIDLPGGKIMYFPCDETAAGALAAICGGLSGTTVRKGVVASGDLFVSDTSKRLLLNERFNALACEMEGAAIGHVCFCCKTPFVILRAVSDDLTANEGVDFVKFCGLAAKKTVAAIDKFFSEA